MGEAENCPQNGDSAKVKSSDPVATDILNRRIISQIEYYFGDINLSKDKFLNEQIKKDDGWVPIETLLTFNRLSSICNDASVVADALGKSSLMRVSEDKLKVRRDPENPAPEPNEDVRKELMKRTVYCKGFPLENVTLDELMEFFKQHGKIDSVYMRHYFDKAKDKKGFKGSTFTIFASVEEAEKFLKIDEVKFKDTVLIKKWQSDYIDDKRKERLEYKLNKQSRRRKNKEATDQDKGETEFKTNSLPPGAVIHISGIPAETQRGRMKKLIEDKGFPVAFVDFSPGDSGGWIRLEHENMAKEFLSKLEKESEGKLMLDDSELEVKVLEGEEETNYLERAKQGMAKRRQMSKQYRKKGNPGRGRKRRFDRNDSDAPPAKIPAAG